MGVHQNDAFLRGAALPSAPWFPMHFPGAGRPLAGEGDSCRGVERVPQD